MTTRLLRRRDTHAPPLLGRRGMLLLASLTAAAGFLSACSCPVRELGPLEKTAEVKGSQGAALTIAVPSDAELTCHPDDMGLAIVNVEPVDGEGYCVMIEILSDSTSGSFPGATQQARIQRCGDSLPPVGDLASYRSEAGIHEVEETNFLGAYVCFVEPAPQGSGRQYTTCFDGQFERGECVFMMRGRLYGNAQDKEDTLVDVARSVRWVPHREPVRNDGEK